MPSESKRTLVARLSQLGYHFREFSLMDEGDYAPADAEWNYRDVPHVAHVHHLVDRVHVHIGDNTIASVDKQRTLGLSLPLMLFQYDSGANSDAYVTTTFFYVLIVESAWEAVPPERTRVTTTYSIGGPRWLLWTIPLIKWLIHRNYRALMVDDLVMRNRRGQLRRWGYRFPLDGARRSFKEAVNVARENYEPAPGCARQYTETVSLASLADGGEVLLGRDDHLGLRLLRTGSSVLALPRSCPHEGASLDGARCTKNRVQCPWHGRVLAPVAVLDAQGGDTQPIETSWHVFLPDGSGSVSVRTRDAARADLTPAPPVPAG